MTRARSIIVAALVVGLAISCTNPMRDTLEAVVQQFSTAGYELNFHNNAGIADTWVIVITFSESMDTDTLDLSGALVAESDGGVWSEDEFPDDTLTISPVSVWTQGGNRTLTVDVDDLQTYPSADISLSYGVLDGVVYVHPDGSDDDHGTFDQPKATIQAAIDDAEAAYDGAEVWVAGGTYELDESITISEDIALLGGYSPANWAVRETDAGWAVSGSPSSYPTEIRYPSIGGTVTVSVYEAAGTPLIDGFTILGPAGVDSTCIQVYDSTATISSCRIEGGQAEASIGVVAYVANLTVSQCHINGGTNDLSTGIFAYQATPTISDCIIEGGNGDQTSAVKLLDSDALIERCTVYGGDSLVDAAGIYAENGSDAVIRNNLIDAGTGPNTFGIWVKASNPLIQNNTIDGGGASPLVLDSIAEGIHMYASSAARIENNIITVTSGDNQYALALGDISSTPAAIRYNCIHDKDNLDYVYLDIDGTDWCATVAELNDLSFATDNVPDNPSLDWAGDWNFTGTPPAEVTAGGINLSAQFTDDILGNPRPAAGSWSMGAYEFN